MVAEHFIDRVDLEARRRAARVIHEKFSEVMERVLEGDSPLLEIPKRTLANVKFDPDRGILIMGEEKIKRDFLNMSEARKFMQTLLMAAIIYQSLVENEYPTIRDLYYRGKHTIVYRDLKRRVREENTWDEQSESDAAIRDIEVYTGLLREDMLILSKEKGKVVGRMTIRSGGDVIDLSKMGHGAYSIESTPDLIEFKDVDAEYVLVVEKDAVFQQLHRIRFWDKHKALLVTGAGQPDRATRRFVRRLNEELKLPVYILTDSIPGDEVVIARDSSTGQVYAGPVEELLAPYFTPGVERERVTAPLQVASWDPYIGETLWAPIGYAYRHYVEDELVEVESADRGTVRVTRAHSLFIYRDGSVTVIPAEQVEVGDYIIAPSRLPPAPSSLSHTLLSWESNPASLDNPVPAGYSWGASRSQGSLQAMMILEESTPSRKGGLEVEVQGTLEAKQLSLLLLAQGLNVSVEESGEGARLRVGAEPPHSTITLDADTYASRVTRVSRRKYKGYVYDFAVPGTNSFTGGYGVVLHNSDPYGWYIYSVFKVGSIQLSYESERLATPKARFLGVSMSDVFGSNGKKPYLSDAERRNYIIRAKELDIKRARELMRYSWFRSKGWRIELKIFLEKKAKLEIEAMASKGLKFLADTYIPEKIQTKDWIE